MYFSGKHFRRAAMSRLYAPRVNSRTGLKSLLLNDGLINCQNERDSVGKLDVEKQRANSTMGDDNVLQQAFCVGWCCAVRVEFADIVCFLRKTEEDVVQDLEGMDYTGFHLRESTSIVAPYILQ